MALVVYDRVKETTTTTGTGTITLAGAVTGYQSFAVVGNGNTTYYCIAGRGTAEWEVGIGTYTAAGTTLARTTILASSNANTAVNFSAGTKDVFVTGPAGKFVTNAGDFATGTWGISVSGNAATATTATNQSGGTINATTGTVTPNASGVSSGFNVVNGDITVYRSGGTTGVVYFGTTGGRYLYYDGTNYNMPNGQLDVNSSRVLNAGNYNSYAPTLTGTGASGSWGINITGTATTATTATTANALNSANNYSVNQLLNATWYNYNDVNRDAGNAIYYPNAATRAVRFFFANASTTGSGGNYAGVMQFNPWDGTTASTGDASYQLVFGSTAANGGGLPQLNIRKGIDTTWNSWYTILHAGNYNSYSPTLTGTGASGSWNISVTGSAANATTANNVFGGAANRIPYNTAANTTSFVAAPTTASTYLQWNGTAFTWATAGGGATGGGSDQIFYENGQTVTTNYTISTNKNAMSAGPITINTGVTVTVPTGSVWTIV